MTACPLCGSITDHAPVYRDGWMIDVSRRVVAYRGPAVSVSQSAAIILRALATKAEMTGAEILAAIGSRGGLKTAHVQVKHARRLLAKNGLPDPIKTQRGIYGGYKWDDHANMNGYQS